MRPRLPVLALALCAAALSLSSPSRAFGPGVHSREAQEVLRRLADANAEYAALAATPTARTWLSLGAISPDFMFMADSLGFGHEPGLSRHLMEQAKDLAPEYRLFALGHACHVASDGSSEAFVVPALFSAAALGPTDLFSDQPAYKEAEGVVESLGDLVTGDWGAVVDLLYDLWMPPADRASFDAVFGWYCQTGAAFLGREVDCAAARAELGLPLAKLEEVLASMDREAAHAFIADLTTMPIDQLMDLALFAADGGSFGGFIGAGLGTGLTPWVDEEIAYLRTTAFVDPAFWAAYDDLAGLGPSFAMDRIADGTNGWPSYDAPGIESGLLASALRYLPDDFTVTTGLMVDELVYRDPDGAPLTEVPAALAGQTLTATLRFYSAFPLAATLTGRVRKDRPGLDAGADPILGEASVTVDIDPTTYARSPRGTLTIPFTADLEGAQAFSVELALGDALPTLTTNRDRLWRVDALDQAGASFRELLGLSPRSLPVATPATTTGLALIEVVVAPDGPPVEGAQVTLGGYLDLTSPRGNAVFGDLPPATHTLVVRHPDHHEHRGELALGAVTSASDLSGLTHLRVALEAILRLTAGDGRWSTSRTELPLRVAAGPFAGQATGFAVTARAGAKNLGAIELPPEGTGTLTLSEAVADGTRLTVKGHAVYATGTGVEASTEVVVDASPPTVSTVLTPTSTRTCLEGGGPWRPSYAVDLYVDEPHSGLETLTWRAPEGAWTSLDFQEDEGYLAAVELAEATLDVDSLEVRAVNEAGLETLATVDLPAPTTLPACVAEPDEDTDAGPADEDDDTAEAAEADPDPDPARSEGCHGGGADGLTLLALLALLARRRAPVS